MHLIIDGASFLIIYVWYAKKTEKLKYWNPYKLWSGELMEYSIGYAQFVTQSPMHQNADVPVFLQVFP